MISLRPNAKINLGLSIRGKRPDGYHLLQTVFYPVALADELTVREAPTLHLDVTGPHAVPATADNLVLRAYHLLAAEVGGLPPVHVALVKYIPAGAGLGGGSSDAAHMLKALVQLFQLTVPQQTLHQIALQLGADVPFFLENQPLLAEGIGEVLTPIAVNLSGYRIELVTPPIHSDTREAYRNLKPAHWSPEVDLRTILAQPVPNWREHLRNDFEPSVFARFPALAEAKAKLHADGAIYASMSGSGSALYGIFPAE